MRKHYFTSESVTEGHPDKICDQISDAILDAMLKQDPNSRVAVETITTTGLITVAGEVTTNATIDVQDTARKTIQRIGYDNPKYGFSFDNCAVLVAIHEQSGDIALGVDQGGLDQGAGDQGIMFGYASNETPEYMPLPIIMAHKITKKLADVRKTGELGWVRPDGKSQVTVEYENGKPQRIDAVVVSIQHDPGVTHDQIKNDVLEKVIKPVCGDWLDENTKYLINPTGKFVIGGPPGDTGLTGRKIIVDTYGGKGSHGGGCFSGKDPSKVDRSATYMARHIAKNIVAAGLADRCEVQISYAIGIPEPVSVFVNTFKTNKIPEDKIEEKVREIFDLRPAAIIEYLKMKRPIFEKTAAYGHFGRDDPDFEWEKLTKTEEFKQLLGDSN